MTSAWHWLHFNIFIFFKHKVLFFIIQLQKLDYWNVKNSWFFPLNKAQLYQDKSIRMQKNKEPHFKFKIEKSVSNQVKLISIIYRLLLNNEEKKEKISKKDCMIVPRLIISLRILISIITTAQRKCTCFKMG